MSQVIKQKRPPKTIKEKKWVKRTIETGDGAKAAREIYDVSSDAGARAIASQNYSKLSLDELMDKNGLTDEHLINKINEGLESNKVISAMVVGDPKDANSRTNDFIDVPDMPTRHKYLETALKLKGKFPSPTLGAEFKDGDKVIRVIIKDF